MKGKYAYIIENEYPGQPFGYKENGKKFKDIDLQGISTTKEDLDALWASKYEADYNEEQADAAEEFLLKKTPNILKILLKEIENQSQQNGTTLRNKTIRMLAKINN